MATKVLTVLEQKGHKVITVEPHYTVASLEPRARATSQSSTLERIGARGSFAHLSRESGIFETGWRSEVNSNCRYRFLNCQTTASCYNLRR